MKLFFLLPFFVVLPYSFTFSQYIESTFITENDLKELKNSTLYVVKGLIESEGYDRQIEEAVKKYWTFCDYEFIDSASYRATKSSAKKFFLVPDFFEYKRYRVRSDYYDRTLAEQHDFIKLKVTRGGGGTYAGQLNYNPNGTAGVASILYALASQSDLRSRVDSQVERNNMNDPDDENSDQTKKPLSLRKNGMNEYIIPLLVKNLQKQCQIVKPGKLVSTRARRKEFNIFTDSIKQKPLYFLLIHFNNQIQSLADVKKHYDGEVHVISTEEYAELIDTESDVNIVNIVSDKEQNYVQVINAKSGTIYYFGRSVVHEKYPRGIIKYHLKKW